MKWRKLGRVYCPDGARGWDQHSALTPTPILLNERTIRVYAGFRDAAGVSRIGFVDVDADDPTRVLAVSARPVIDIGSPGCFDDNGMILGDIVAFDGALHMYYIGFQLVAKAKFLAFTGLAISEDGGESFQRVSRAPVLDRADHAVCFHAIHSILIEDGRWHAWCGTGSDWRTIADQSYPSYSVTRVDSPDGRRFSSDCAPCLQFEGDEYRIGRPRVYRDGDRYRMFYTIGTLRGTYLPGYAESSDGVYWQRRDSEVGIAPSADGWDSLALSYPALLWVRSRVFMFYNGNQMGKTGFGVAELESGSR